MTAGKTSTRQRILAARNALGDSAREQFSISITNKLLALPGFGLAQAVAAYISFGSEFDTTAFITEVLGSGKRLLLPRVDRGQRAIIFHAVTDAQESLLPGAWGIREPDPLRCPQADLDDVELMLVPGLAFTIRCERLGYGGGFYDAAIEMTRPNTLKVAAAFSAQIVDTLVVEPHDRSVDMVVTESASYFSGVNRS